MKNYLIFLVLLAMYSCNQKNQAELPGDLAERNKIYQSISQNPETMEEFMVVAMQSDTGRMMMRNGHMGPMHRGGRETENMNYQDTTQMGRGQRRQQMMHMMQRCRKDSAACREMADMMAQNPQMMRHMMQRMQSQGMMSEECARNTMSKIDSVQ